MTATGGQLALKRQLLERYVSLGLHVLFIHGIKDGLCTCGNPTCAHAGKHPLLPNGVYGATTDLEWLEAMLESQPHANLAIAMGRQSGVMTLDLDSQAAIDEARTLGVPRTWVFKTGKGEQHVFRYPKLRAGLYIANAVQIADGMDVRSDGGYSVVPPSRHISGKTYTWVVDTTEPLADVPEWLYDRLVIKNETAAVEDNEINETVEPKTEGGRNDYLFRFGASLRAKSLTYDELVPVLRARNNARCQPPLPDEEVLQIAESVIKYKAGATGAGAAKTKEIEEKIGPIDDLPEIFLTASLTDAGNAECFVAKFKDDFRFCRLAASQSKLSKGFFHWTGIYWAEDTWHETTSAAVAVAEARAKIAPQAPVKEDRVSLFRHAQSSLNLPKIDAAITLVGRDPHVRLSPSDWDRDDWKLGVVNGTINLRTGEFQEPDRLDYITRIASVMYDEEATCPLWEKTISEIFEDNPEIVPYFQRALGYCLTGSVKEHVMWFWYGGGANGKSTIINLWSSLLGDFAGATTFATFDTQKQNAMNDDLAGLRGKRFVTATEGSQGRKLAEEKIKAVSSGDMIRCRFLFNDYFEYRPTYKVVLATNHMPEVVGTDEGIWRRIHLIPFNQTFGEDRRDKELEGKLRKELPGMLNWGLKGLRSYQELGGLMPPPVVVRSTAELRASSDMFRQWFEEQLEPSPDDTLRMSEAYTSYRLYMKSSGENPLPKSVWQRQMKMMGISFTAKVSGDHATRGWRIVHSSL